MPLNTGAALAVSLIPAAVILVYNLMEIGVPGGTLKNFINKDLVVSGSASYLAEKNVSVIANSTAVESFIESVSNSIQSPSTVSSSIVEKTTTSSSTAAPTTARTTITTTVPTTTTTTTTTPAPVNYPKLPVCCENVRVSGGRVVGSCGNTASTQDEGASKQGGDVWNVPTNLMATGSDQKFTFQTSSPSCKDGKFIGQLPLSSDVIISDDHFLSNGMLKYKNEFYQSDQFCIRGFGQTEDVLEVQICKVNCSNPASPCVHKCCGYDEIYSMGMKGHRGGCLRMDPSKNESMWAPTLYDDDGTKLTSEQLTTAGIRPHIIQSNPTRFRHLCPRNATTVFPYGQQVAEFLSTVLRYPFSALKFKMRKDGFLISDPNANPKIVAISKTVRTTKFCIDGVKNYGETVDYLNLEEQTVLFLCLGGPEEFTTLREEKGENLVAAASSNQPKSEVTAAPSTTTTSTTTSTTTTPSTTPPTTTTSTTPPTTTTSTTPPTTTTSTTPPTTTTTTTSTTTPKPTTTTTTTTTTTPTTTSSTTTTSTTTTPKPTSPSTTTTTSTTTKPPTTTTVSTTPATTTTTEPPPSTPVLPVCCPLDPDAEDGDGNEISHHCKFSGNSGEQVEVKSTNSTKDLWIASPNFMFTHKITKFRLEVKPLKCQKWTKVFVHNLGKLLSPTEPVLMPNGMLKIGNDYYHGGTGEGTKRNGEFCLNGIFPNIVEVLVCKTNCSDPQTPCIQKCCAPNEIYSLGVGGKKRGCVPLDSHDTPFDPPLHKDMNTKVSATELENMTPHLVQKYPPKFQYSCFKNVTLVFPFSGDVVQLMSPLAQINLEFKLRQDGKIIYKHPSIRNSSGDLIESAFSTSSFCVDGIRNFGKSEPDGPYRNFENQNILFVCAVKPPPRVP